MNLPDPLLPIEDQSELIVLAMLVYGEGRGESDEAKCAIAHVPIERARLKKTSVKRECLRKNAFSCFNENDKNRSKLLRPLKWDSPEVWMKCLSAADDALSGRSSSPAKGATHYVVKRYWMRPSAAGRHPEWFELLEVASGHTKKIKVIGGHVFAKCAF